MSRNWLRSIWLVLTDHGIVTAAAFFATFVAASILSDLLPPGIESTFVSIICFLLVTVVVGIVGALVSKLVHVAFRAHWQFGLRSLFVVVSIHAVFFAMTTALGFRTATYYLFVFLQMITPVLFVRYGAQTGSVGAGAFQGSLVGFVSFFVLTILYVLIVGIQGGHFVGNIGPGLTGLENLQPLMFFWMIAIWPIPVVQLAGAIGGIVGWKLRCRTCEGRSLLERDN